ncbi:hypothetical protein [Tropicibacter sp. S64]|uniref:hypothetical protein n=1 Tax=Tropicibacter sp. S64 TaxID=3415122 RepID=UPI003C7B98F7
MTHFTGLAAALLLMASPALAQNLISQNTSIHDRLCIGADCQAVETYASDLRLLRLKSRNAAIEYIDTTTDPNYVTNPWIIQFNDTSAGGEPYIKFRDVAASTEPFRVNGGARTSALLVDDTGAIGLGTSIPTAELDIRDSAVNGGRSQIKMEATFSFLNATEVKTGTLEFSTGFGLSNFYLHRNTGTFPVRFSVDAPDNAFNLISTGGLGLGGNPDVPLHVKREDGTAALRVENTAASPAAAREMFRMVNNGGSYFTLANTASGKDWFFVHENAAAGRFFINHSDGGRQMALDAAGNMTIEGQLMTAGSCSAGCDRVFDEDYPLPSIPEQAALMKANKHLPNVGPTPENGPFNLTAMTGGMLNELEKAHLYIAELHEENAAQAQALAALTERMARMEALLAASAQ